MDFHLHNESYNKSRDLTNAMRNVKEASTYYLNKRLVNSQERDSSRWLHSSYKEFYENKELQEGGRYLMVSPQRRIRPAQSPPSCLSNAVSSRSPRCTELFSQKEKYGLCPNIESPKDRRCQSPRPAAKRRLDMSKLKNSKKDQSHSSKSAYCFPNKVSNPHSSASSCSDDSCSMCYEKIHRRSKNRRSAKIKSSIKSCSTDSKLNINIFDNKSPPCTSRVSVDMTREAHYTTKQTEKQNAIIESKSAKQVKNRSTSFEDPRKEKGRKLIKDEKPYQGFNIPNEKDSAESSVSDESDSSSTASQQPPPKMTLSERFGRMAQWSVDRRDVDNMQITKVGNDMMKVVVQGQPATSQVPESFSPPGHYPETLLTQCPRGLDSWDDVCVRYNYYKVRGYLRDLTLEDYIKWEEWWYKYQEWLETERYYEKWSRPQRSNSNRKRRARRQNSML